jgi:hypothetical protein
MNSKGGNDESTGDDALAYGAAVFRQDDDFKIAFWLQRAGAKVELLDGDVVKL